MIRKILNLFWISLLAVQVVGSDLKYCIIVDTSVSMAPKKQAAVEMVREIVESGFDKQILTGEKFAIWVYNEKNYYNRLPIQKWDALKPEEFVGTATRFLAGEVFANECRFEYVVYDINRFIAAHRDVLLTLITDGETPVAGIEFDIEINTEMGQQKARLGAERRPFLISLLALQGKIRSWKLYTGEEAFTLPVLPYDAVAAKKREEAERLAAEKKAKEVEAKLAEKKKKEEEKPIIRDLPFGARVVTATPPPAVKANPVISTNQNASPAVIQTNVLTVTVPEQKTLEKKTNVLETNFTAVAQVSGPPPPPKGEKNNEPAVTTPIPEVPASYLPSNSTGTTVLFYSIAAAGFLLALGIVVIYVQRRMNTRGSIISQSILRDYKSP